MTQLLEQFLSQTVEVITSDGRIMVGTLKGFDQAVNVILDGCHERVFSTKGVETVVLGLYVIRGDNVALIGNVDQIRDKAIDFHNVHAEPLGPVRH